MTSGALFQSFFASLACANVVLAVSGMMLAFVALVLSSSSVVFSSRLLEMTPS